MLYLGPNYPRKVGQIAIYYFVTPLASGENIEWTVYENYAEINHEIPPKRELRGIKRKAVQSDLKHDGVAKVFKKQWLNRENNENEDAGENLRGKFY